MQSTLSHHGFVTFTGSVNVDTVCTVVDAGAEGAERIGTGVACWDVAW